MKRLANPVLLLAAFSGISCAAMASEYKWIGQITEDGGALSYAFPQSGAIKIDFHWDRKTRKIVVNFEHEPQAVKDGMRLTTRLSLRVRDVAGSADIAATGQRLEPDEKFLLSSETRMSPQVRQVLSSDGVLLVTAGSRSEEIPLKGAALAARQLFGSCPG